MSSTARNSALRSAPPSAFFDEAEEFLDDIFFQSEEEGPTVEVNPPKRAPFPLPRPPESAPVGEGGRGMGAGPIHGGQALALRIRNGKALPQPALRALQRSSSQRRMLGSSLGR